jgi:Cof subfamily protein (haloacid dehalogenase superfamily)
MPPNSPAPDGAESGWSGKISLLLSDVDGTLVTHDKVLTPRAIEAVQALDDSGIQFTVTSSRPPRGLSKLIAPLDLRLPIGGFNGCALVRPDMSIVETLLLSPDAAREALKIITAHGLDPWVYTEAEWLVHDTSAPHVAREEFTLSFPAKAVQDFGDALDHVGKLVAVGDDTAARDRCHEELNMVLGGQASATRSQTFFIDVTHPDANKGTLVGTLSRILSIPTEEIATIGDMENDVLMFRKSGLSIAMGNAEPNVKSQAKLVTDTNDADGFAKAVERFLLGQPEVAA